VSEKRQVPTFRLRLAGGADWVEGPVVAPDRLDAAEDLNGVHRLLQHHGGILVYEGEWVYVPLHAVNQVRRGRRWFALPWPLTDADEGQEGTV
jgi:hypothetical protein